jgi:uncharacterized protein YbaR (Trm112 family)
MSMATDDGSKLEVIDQRLVELLVCPVDKQPVRVNGASLVCTACGRMFPIEDGIPNMLIDDES